ncbi:hypothetical protein GGS23DRAFT_620856 [Durotheca rogersii]|uniref:uncharacterized protein n=1 Tax=Durotheca rogersii TaxID=419775 RepID=UPI00222017D7|nr:uncharacterized protein GGS23DRAFT_620856 [Durotheca rogersii]KAI5863954.1 hypothetical protein GGS23DRAFT_620856 [Durotheca rogersii]
MSDLVRKLIALVPGTTYSATRRCMKLYATRNDTAHGHIGELARTRKFLALAVKLKEDLAALQCERNITEEERAATKAAIWYNVDLYFEELEYDELTCQITLYVPWPQESAGKFIRTAKRLSSRAVVEENGSSEEDEESEESEDEDIVIVHSVSPDK